MEPPVRFIGESNESFFGRQQAYNDWLRNNRGGGSGGGGGFDSRPVHPAVRVVFALALWVAILYGFWQFPFMTAYQPFSGLIALALVLTAFGHTFPKARWWWILLAPLAFFLTIALTVAHGVAMASPSSRSSPAVSQKQHKLLHHHHHKPS